VPAEANATREQNLKPDLETVPKAEHEKASQDLQSAVDALFEGEDEPVSLARPPRLGRKRSRSGDLFSEGSLRSEVRAGAERLQDDASGANDEEVMATRRSKRISRGAGSPEGALAETGDSGEEYDDKSMKIIKSETRVDSRKASRRRTQSRGIANEKKRDHKTKSKKKTFSARQNDEMKRLKTLFADVDSFKLKTAHMKSKTLK